MDENDTRVMWWVADPSQVTIGKTYKFKAVMQTERDPDLLKSPVFKPGIAVNYYHREKHGVVTGNSVTITEPGISATFSADNAVDWAASSCSSDERFDFWFNQAVSDDFWILYDDFNSGLISPEKWYGEEAVRREGSRQEP